MATFTLQRSLLLLLPLLSLFSTTSEAKPSFTFTSFGKNSTFDSDDIALFGEAKLLDGGSSISIQVNDSVSHNSGRVVYKKPIKFVETKSEYPAGFSTFIAFSVSPDHGGRLGFVVFPVNGTFDQSLFEVKFDTLDKDSNVSVSVDGTSVPEEIRSFTIANLEEEENKEKVVLLYAWINYIAGGKFLEVRLSKSESFEHVDPLMFTRIDLSGMLKGKGDEFMVGVKSYGGSLNLHSWSLEARSVPKGEHSYAAIMVEKLIEEEEAKKRRRARAWGIVTCFVMTFGSTGLVFFALMHIWAAFKRNNLAMVMQEECGIKTKEFEYEKMEKMEAVMSKTDSTK
ncbi:L-type lectin-domain containing receptor kinase VIII.2 [Brassica rapa]|uniref:Legume lectin domain-containing protein n=2 Tax=Brassica campestris TaxID=3711 RepID=M4CS51_BRACM|nr:L-type lectin-domain containing receptor kinase VIII.2 [Brassica rapa]